MGFIKQKREIGGAPVRTRHPKTQKNFNQTPDALTKKFPDPAKANSDKIMNQFSFFKKSPDKIVKEYLTPGSVNYGYMNTSVPRGTSATNADSPGPDDRFPQYDPDHAKKDLKHPEDLSYGSVGKSYEDHVKAKLFGSKKESSHMNSLLNSSASRLVESYLSKKILGEAIIKMNRLDISKINGMAQVKFAEKFGFNMIPLYPEQDGMGMEMRNVPEDKVDEVVEWLKSYGVDGVVRT